MGTVGDAKLSFVEWDPGGTALGVIFVIFSEDIDVMLLLSWLRSMVLVRGMSGVRAII